MTLPNFFFLDVEALLRLMSSCVWQFGAANTMARRLTSASHYVVSFTVDVRLHSCVYFLHRDISVMML